MSIRLAHLSDIHITVNPLGWKLRDWFNKRFPGWINFRWLGRASRFRRAEAVLSRLVEELRERRPEWFGHRVEEASGAAERGA